MHFFSLLSTYSIEILSEIKTAVEFLKKILPNFKGIWFLCSKFLEQMVSVNDRGVINGKAGKHLPYTIFETIHL